MGWCCGGCKHNRGLPNPAYRSCKSTRLCSIVSVAALMRHRGKPLDWYRTLDDGIAMGHVALSEFVTQSAFPMTGTEFMQLIRLGHRRLFAVEREIAGRFRQPGETVQFGTGSYLWSGAPIDQIERQLGDLWCAVTNQICGTVDKCRAVQVAAFFLERFFLIHPFVDGNGRVGRAVAGMIVRRCGAFDIGSKAMRLGARQRRRYGKALNYAHLRAAPLWDDVQEVRSRKQPHPESIRKYLDPLIRVMSDWIVDVPDNEVAEAGPPPVGRRSTDE